MSTVEQTTRRRTPGGRGLLVIAVLAVAAVAAVWFVARRLPFEPPPREGAARNLILYWGDGNSEVAMRAASLLEYGQEGMLHADGPVDRGSMTTHSADSSVTDSAASATAAATGQKTNNGRVGTSPTGERLTNIFELAKESGMAIGIVSTSFITDASPAAFAAHVARRGQLSDIAQQILELSPQVVLGGGEEAFLPTEQVGGHPAPGIRTDGRNLIDEATSAGYRYVSSEDELAALDCATVDRVLGLFGDQELYTDLYVEDDEAAAAPSLEEMAECAIASLSRDPDGYFLMVEEEGIDSFGHDNDAESMLEAVLGFDEAVGDGLDLARQRTDTLTIVASDHETGGMAVDERDDESCDSPAQELDGREGTEFCVAFSTTEHTDRRVPVAGLGPASAAVEGVTDNTELFVVMRDALGLR